MHGNTITFLKLIVQANSSSLLVVRDPSLPSTGRSLLPWNAGFDVIPPIVGVGGVAAVGQCAAWRGLRP